MKFYNIYYESGERINGQVTNRKLRDVHSYIDFGDGRVSKFVYANIQGVKDRTKTEKRFDVVVKESIKGDCVSIHLIMIPNRNPLSELGLRLLLDELLQDLEKDCKELKEKKLRDEEDDDMVD